MFDVRRREFITLLGGAAAWPLAARAQQRARRIGMLETIPPQANAANFDALRKGLRELGYDEGRNLIIEYRSADGRAERFPALAAEPVCVSMSMSSWPEAHPQRSLRGMRPEQLPS
jgi:putative tryptophan/tyrosine transport system substrate-binding protein